MCCDCLETQGRQNPEMVPALFVFFRPMMFAPHRYQSVRYESSRAVSYCIQYGLKVGRVLSARFIQCKEHGHEKGVLCADGYARDLRPGPRWELGFGRTEDAHTGEKA